MLPVFFLLIVSVHVVGQAVATQDPLALVDLYNSANEPQWNVAYPWLQGLISGWSGVNLIDDKLYVKSINLYFSHLTGYIPESMGNLSELEHLSLEYNDLHDTIPSSLGKLYKLQPLWLDLNQRTGSIASGIGLLPDLIWLDGSGNQLSGPVPENWGSMPNLQKIGLRYKQFTFTGLEALVSKGIIEISYDNQTPVLPILSAGNKLYVQAGGHAANNTSEWYHNGGIDKTVTGDSNYVPDQPGLYRVYITNSIARDLILISDTFRLFALPLKLSSFIGQLVNSNINLDWTKTQEQNISHFVVQRSLDGVQFSAIGRIGAAGNSQQIVKYRYTDVFVPTLGVRQILYKLVQVDKDGTQTLSKVVTVLVNRINGVTIYPNPTKQVITVDLHSGGIGKLLTIFNLSGRLVWSELLSAQQKQKVYLPSLAQGLYQVVIRMIPKSSPGNQS